MAEQPSRILIVDDDADFASLLSDVFAQASYEVEAISDPRKADEIVKKMEFSLVVTDLRMPDIDGLELSRRIRTVQPNVPIIVVSGFLDAKTREQMEKEGVVGLYEKPLSVFSLLKNAANLIADGKKRAAKAGDPGKGGDQGGGLGFEFSALPCESDASRAFAEGLYRLRNRRTNLYMIAPKGTPARTVAKDFSNWVTTDESIGILLEPGDCTESRLGEIVDEAAGKGRQAVNLLVTDVEQLDLGQQKQLARATRKGTLRENWTGSIRLVLIVGADLETLYQQGAIEDELYLSMGGGELTIPRLKECSADIRALALATTDESGNPFEWEEDALRSLTERDWPGNHAELRKVLVRLQQKTGGAKITATDVIAAVTEEEKPSSGAEEPEKRSLFEILTECRASYLQAAYHLLGEDLGAVAEMAHVPQELVEDSLNLRTESPEEEETHRNVRSPKRRRTRKPKEKSN